tara:strand:- start:299 stop:655 length:357 start_codon:yes stop_codon:yes gene_type:complete
MKYLKNDQMVGYQEIPLTFKETDDENEVGVPLTVRKLFLLGCNTFQSENMKDWKIIADAMTKMDGDEKEETAYLELENDWYGKIRPHLDTILPKAYKIHSPFMAEQLDQLVKDKKPAK